MYKKSKINVLMVTGVYFPEVNGATLQCMRIISLLKNNNNFTVISTTKHKDLAGKNIIEGIDIFRFYIGSRVDQFLQVIKILFVFFTKNFNIVHLHGFSSRSALIVIISKLFNKKIIIYHIHESLNLLKIYIIFIINEN